MILRSLLANFLNNQEHAPQSLGTTPIVIPQESKQKALKEETPMPPTAKRILLVEDSLISQKVTTIQLKHFGYSVDIAENGSKALEALKENSYGLIFMDCFMPEMNGYQATKEIRKVEKLTGKHTPIIALTGGDLADDQNKCLAVGMDGYLAKPIKVDDLVKTLGYWYPSEKIKSLAQ